MNAPAHAPRLLRPVVAIAMAFTLAACAATHAPGERDLPDVPAITLPASVRVRVGDRIRSVPFEDYVVTTALSEVSPVGESEATAAGILELQTILARTYAASHLGRHRAEGFDLCDTTHCQVYNPARLKTSRFADLALRAGRATAGQIVTYGQRPAEALFHADCGGHTASAEAVWGGRAVPYLVGGPDDVPGETHQEWQFEATDARVRDALNASPLASVGPRLTSIRVMDRDASGRAAHIELKGDVTRRLRGEQVRAILNQTFGFRAIRSTRFSVDQHEGGFRFEGTGFGHGVGVCQVGAAARIRRGESLASVLSVYYPGARLTVAF